VKALFVYKNDAVRWGEVSGFRPSYEECEVAGIKVMAYDETRVPSEPNAIHRFFVGYKMDDFILYVEK